MKEPIPLHNSKYLARIIMQEYRKKKTISQLLMNDAFQSTNFIIVHVSLESI